MYIDTPMKSWNDPLADADIGGVFLSMCGFFTTTLTLSIENETVVDMLISALTKLSKA